MVSTLFLYCIASFTVTVIPGPTMLLSLSNGTTEDRKVITYGIAGAALSDIILISAVGLGLGVVVASSELLFSVIQYCGAAYLIFISYNLWRSSPSAEGLSAGELNSSQVRSPSKAFKRNLFAALSNPKGLLFFGAFLPQFLDVSKPLFAQYVTFAFATVLIDVIIMFVYAMAGYQASKYLSSYRLSLLNRICSAVLLAMAVGLALYRHTS
ncbi:LysE family translocator [Thaumasiovibrio sp. DFM-14]|uniref:LysE family translocator n=1 Tax=Thaumasiovibrio sp. DFM-14 TaxID=3384792 RepID=UPI00399F4E47